MSDNDPSLAMQSQPAPVNSAAAESSPISSAAPSATSDRLSVATMRRLMSEGLILAAEEMRNREKRLSRLPTDEQHRLRAILKVQERPIPED